MKNCLAVLALSIVATVVSLARGGADCCPHCGCASLCWEPVIAYRCKLVPDHKPIKKVAYECKEVPYCEHRLPRFGHCDTCPECEACPRFKRVLVKKDVSCGELCGTKCVVEKFVRHVATCSHCGYESCGAAAQSCQQGPASPATAQQSVRSLPPLHVVPAAHQGSDLRHRNSENPPPVAVDHSSN